MIEVEREITVKLKWSLDEAKINFVNKGMRLVDSFILKDIYLVREDIDFLSLSNLEILSKVMIIRERISANSDKMLVRKNKKYDENGDIVDSMKYTCPLVDIEATYNLLVNAGFKECFRYDQECLVYSSEKEEIVLEYIPELGLFAEIEDNTKSIKELIDILNDLDIPYYENDYFVKKASLMLDIIKKQKR